MTDSDAAFDLLRSVNRMQQNDVPDCAAPPQAGGPMRSHHRVVDGRIVSDRVTKNEVLSDRGVSNGIDADQSQQCNALLDYRVVRRTRLALTALAFRRSMWRRT
jgi:hypothetical protein